jgi:transketolase
MRPITYTITPFATTRCLEQIRVDLCYHNLPVLVVGVGAGLSYSSLGPTHHSCEDLAFLRSLPNMTVFAPGDPLEVEMCLEQALQLPGPAYLRLGKKGEPQVHKERLSVAIGEAIQMEEGTDVALLSTGTSLPTVVAARERLIEKGISVSLYSFPTVKPLDEERLQEIFSSHALVCTVEEHSLIGGFGSAVAEYKAQANLPGRLYMIGTPDMFLDHTGSQALKLVGLDAESIATRIMGVLDATGCRL